MGFRRYRKRRRGFRRRPYKKYKMYSRGVYASQRRRFPDIPGYFRSMRYKSYGGSMQQAWRRITTQATKPFGMGVPSKILH